MAVRKAEGLLGSLSKWAYNLSGFNKYGLRHDDILNDHHEDVQEAIRRLPLKIQDERNFRLTRAAQLSLAKTQLPKEEWTKWEEDERYLLPYLEEVRKERDERSKWDKV